MLLPVTTLACFHWVPNFVCKSVGVTTWTFVGFLEVHLFKLDYLLPIRTIIETCKHASAFKPHNIEEAKGIEPGKRNVLGYNSRQIKTI